MLAVMISWHSGGLWDGGEFVFIGLLIGLFWFQCVVGPTAMAIASMIAIYTKTIMGIQQMSMNLGMALGPILGSVLFQINLYAPVLWLMCFEVCVLALNYHVLRMKRASGELDRNLFDFSAVAAPGAGGAKDKQDADDAGTEGAANGASGVEDAKASQAARLGKIQGTERP